MQPGGHGLKIPLALNWWGGVRFDRATENVPAAGIGPRHSTAPSEPEIRWAIRTGLRSNRHVNGSRDAVLFISGSQRPLSFMAQ